ncbi:MAG: AAA family ATPase [Azonexus sp.]|jgi:SpoVK/Ycf46/Vps4 family AAA+-type ATPase|nr:AAA family ATPase [Azonexus sp.]
MDDLNDLRLVLRSRFPLVIIESHEEAKVRSLIEKATRADNLAFFTWSVADGLKRENFRYDSGSRDRQWNTVEGYRPALERVDERSYVIDDTQPLQQALRFIEKTCEAGIYLLCDAHPFLDDPVNLRLLKEIAHSYNECPRTLVLLSPELALPPDLARHTARFTLRLPDLAAIRAMIRSEFDLYATQNEGRKVTGDNAALPLLVQHLAGLCEEDVKRLIRLAIRDDGALTMSDIERILKSKQEMLAEGSLEIEIDTGSMAQIGGMATLKRWLAQRRAVFIGDAAAEGLDAPRGVLLLGVQGAGKSLAARTIAGTWGVPLLRLDFATLYNKFHGETERNLRAVLNSAVAMAPCVLWIDEIEKGLATGNDDADGGVSRRVLGTLLTWMAERKARVFMVATANDISRLPPELMRKGRFDEIFFVDLPSTAVRAEIFRIHLARRRIEPGEFDVAALASAAAGFSGAEIEQAIVSALYEALGEKQPLSERHIVDEIARTRPLSVIMAEQVATLRAWAAGRTVMADAD